MKTRQTNTDFFNLCVCADSSVFTPRGSHPISWTLHTHTHTHRALCWCVLCLCCVEKKVRWCFFSALIFLLFYPLTFMERSRWIGADLFCSVLLFIAGSFSTEPVHFKGFAQHPFVQLTKYWHESSSSLQNTQWHPDWVSNLQCVKTLLCIWTRRTWREAATAHLVSEFFFWFFFVNIWTELTASAALFYTLNHCVATLGLWPHLRSPRIQMELPEMTSNWFKKITDII